MIAWISRTANTRFLTSSTRAQLEMGVEISKKIVDMKSLIDTLNQCFRRDREWTEYHAETLAELDRVYEIDVDELKHASVERRAFRLMRESYHEKAISILNKYCQEASKLDEQSKGWLLQFAARIAYYWGRREIVQELQQRAYACNHNLMRPQILPPYMPLRKPGKQAEAIVSQIEPFRVRRGYLAEFEEEVSHLTPSASANQFEQALANFGTMLGFRTERPDRTYGKGPDVLWLLNDNLGLVIEVKSRKNKDNFLTKEQHGQLLNAAEWFKEKYPQYHCIRVSVHPNVNVTKATVTGESRALTFDKLAQLIADARKLLSELCESVVPNDELVDRCEQLLLAAKLDSASLIAHYLVPFEPPHE